MSTTTPAFLSFSARSTATPSATSTPVTTNSITGMSFVGNTPSTVLFFLAMAVGVAIAILFIFFTARYFIRAKFGLHLYSGSSRGMMFSPRSAARYNPIEFTDREIQEHLEYLRSHHFLRDDFLERRLNASSNRRRRRRRRRGRFAKMKKLSAEEVEDLFPKTRYADWLNTGDDDSSVSVEVAKDNESIGSISAKLASAKHSSTTALEIVELNEAPVVASEHSGEEQSDTSSSSASSRGKTELHFDSGSCSICLEVFESDDIVRGLICGHVYHSDCVDPWLTLRRACCPICKRDYYKEENTASAEDGNPNAEDIPQDSSPIGEDEPPNGSIEEQDGERLPETIEIREENLNESAPEHASEEAETNTPVNPLSTEPQENAETEAAEPADILQDINYDVIRRDANIQALFNELIPLSERVRVLLDEYPQYDLDAKAKMLSKKKYGNIFKKILWRLMGISKKDLYNWAVITVYQEEQASRVTTGDINEQETEVSGEDGNHRSEVLEGSPGEALEMSEIRRTSTGPAAHISAATSVYHNAEEDLADAARRHESVQDRV